MSGKARGNIVPEHNATKSSARKPDASRTSVTEPIVTKPGANKLSISTPHSSTQRGHFLGALGLSLPLALGMVLSLTLNTAKATPQEADFLRRVAEQYILAQFQHQNNDVKIQVQAGRLDERRNFNGKCEGYLTAELRGNEVKSTSQVIINCSQPGNTYSIVVPVRVTMLNMGLVAAHNLSRGARITSSDLEQIYIEETANLSTAVSDPNILVGSRLKRDIKEGDQIRSSDFCVVCKNDKVSIIARSHGLSLKTSGLALDDGGINQSIRVRNLKSQKIISGVVTAPAQVEVVF